MQPAASSLDALVRLPHGQPQGSTPAASTGSMMMMPIMTAGRRLVIVPHGQTAKALGVPKPLEIPKPMAIPNLDALYPVLKQEPHSQRGQHAQDWSGQGGAPPGLFMQASDIGGSAGPPSGCAEGAAGRAAARAAAQITEQAGSQGLRRSTRATKPMRAISSNEMSVSDDPEEAEAPSPKRGKRIERRRAGRPIEPVGDPAGGALTPDQVRLVRRRLHNRKSARRSRTKRQMTYEEQTLQMRAAVSQTQVLTQQVAVLQTHCRQYHLKVQQMQMSYTGATRQCAELQQELERLHNNHTASSSSAA
ncbi:hypothetical protein WJX84_007827 [Apatococcus fuscideae]|uniref:BZIP domain-containing protein n=1 Tax=Apatococcus fuscideae TaxID=2026836 RepID=A0AAW1T3B8_9CHLO